MRRGGGGWRSGPPPLENYKNIGFLSNTGWDSLKNLKATKPAFHVGPPSARQRDADGPLIVVFGSFLPSSNCQSWTPSDKNFWNRA